MELDLDVSLLLDIDVNAVFSELKIDTLKLEDLNNIDWELVSSSVLGITDPIGQLREWLAGVLSGFFDTLRRFFEGLIKPVADFVSRIFDAVGLIRTALSTLIDTVSRVVVTPILDALKWIGENIPRLTGAVRDALSRIAETIAKLPDVVRDFAGKAAVAFSELAERVTSGFRWLLDQIGKLPDLVKDLTSRVLGVFSDLVDRVKAGFTWFIEQVSKLPDVVKDLVGKAATLFGDLADKIRGGFAWFIEQVAKLPDFIRDLIGKATALFGDLADKIRAGFSWFIEQVAKIPDMMRDLIGKVIGLFSDLADKVKSGFAWLIEQVGRMPDVIRDLISRVAGLFGDLADKIRAGFSWFIEQVSKLPDTVRDMLSRVAGTIGDLLDRVKAGFSWFIEQITKLPDIVRDISSRVVGVFSDLLDKVKAGFTWLLEQVAKLPDIVKGVVEKITSTLLDLAERAGKGLSTLLDMISKAPAFIKDTLTTILGDVVKGVGGVVEWIRKGFEGLGGVISSWFEGARGWFETATSVLKQVGSAFMGFVNAVIQLPERLRAMFEGVVKFFENLWTGLQEFIRDPVGWFRKYIVEPVWRGLVVVGSTIWDGLVKFGELVWSGITWLWDKVVAGVTWVRDKLIDLGKMAVEGAFKTAEGVSDWFEKLLASLFKPGSPPAYVAVVKTQRDVEAIMQEALKRTVGVAENLWILGGELVWQFWRLTLIPFIIRGIVKALGDFEIVFEPSVVGSKGGGLRWSIRAGELADAFVRGFEMFYSGYGIGVSMAIANMFVVNLGQLYTPRVVAYYDRRIKNILGDVLKEEFETGALVNMFLKPVSETALIDYARRMLALSEGIKDEKRLKQLLSTIKAHLKIYGLPAWYIDYLTRHPEELKVGFVDRFGADRRIYLSHIFELPTHSELARMTQRDIFPGVDVMKKVAWVRGWNEDLTTMIYLLTFKYPSFEKLWTFYMRALSGMLWFKAPEHIKAVFDKEAEEVKAGKPISPLDLQKALLGPDQVKAFETALNTYFKWLEYSNFSWFTDKTTMYGINIGAEVVSKLGGWTADSWLLADVAADIPSKIDMRWMSRYGIFLHMAKRFEEAGVRFETYTPLVEAVPKLIEASAATPIQVDLRWFSKLLQATGLHPAWVPIVTVAENIMAIADEMTLLRTGWLNLFKEGMITVDDAEKYLAGLIVTSYLVGYWDPEKKMWTSGWINLPVRWLPHERKLLELRMAIDRVMDVFREIYSYIRSGIRTLAITPEDAKSKLTKLVDELNKHYKELTRAITGREFEIKLDEKYIATWLEVQKLAQDIEAYERVRIWWSRVSGWILYRVAYGWVTEEEIVGLIDTVSKYIPLHRVEVEAYIEIAKALLGIARKEAIPSPSTLATFAEYMVIGVKVVEDVLSKYNVPREYWDLWKTYIAVKPIKADYKAVLNTALKALRYAAVSREYYESLLKSAEAYGFTPVEISLISLRSELELLIDEAKLWRPTLLTLISMIEYVPEAVKLLEYYRVDPVFKPVVEKYALVKPLADEVRVLVNALYRAKRYVAIPKEIEERAVSIAKSLGVTDVELAIRDLALELQVLVDEAKVWVPTPSTIATLSEYVVLPRELVEQALKIRRVPEEWTNIWLQYILVKPVKSDYKAVLMSALRALRYNAITREYWDTLLKAAGQYGFTPIEVDLLQLRAELELMIEEARLWRPSLLTLITISEYVPEAVKLLEYYRVDPVFKPVIERYALVKPLADEVRILVNALYRAKRYVAIPKELEDRVLSIVKQFGVTDIELMIRDLALELTILVDEAREYVPTPSTLATMAEYLPEVRKYIAQVFETRRIRGVWAEVWTKYIYLRPVFDEVRRWATAMFTLAEYLIIDVKQLEPVFKILMTYGWEELEVTIATRTILAEQVRHAFSAVLGAPRTITAMSRYTDKAADWAYSRAVKLIDALPVDDATKRLLKEMWKEYIMSYQAYPEIRSYETELINAYADGVIDDKGLEDELGYLRKIGVPELRLAFVKRTAQLRRARRMARARY